MSRILARGALMCALISLTVGVAIFLLWVATRQPALEVAGFFWLMTGTALVVLGLGLLLLARLSKDRISGARAGWTLALLLINFPAAFGVVVLSSGIKYASKSIDLMDPSRSVTLTLSTRDPHPNTLSVQVRGDLDGVGRFRVGEGNWVDVGPGRVDRVLRSGDYYEPEAILIYQPTTAKGGWLRVEYRFQ